MRFSLMFLSAVVIVFLQARADAQVCAEVEALEGAFQEDDFVENDYFDEYFVRSEDGAYFVLAKKKISLDFARVCRVMSTLETHDQFIPGYQEILVRRPGDQTDGGAIYTGIRFVSFYFFESRFTNRVEISETARVYRQCWKQLDADAPEVVVPHLDAPLANRGYWRITHVSEQSDKVELRYFSNIQPPIPLPDFLYKLAVENRLQRVFESVVARVRTASD